MVGYIHRLTIQGRSVTLSWVGKVNVIPARVYAVAFVSPDEILLDSDGPEDPHRWMPGGGMEPGETPEDALARELLEEADATIVAMEELGSQRMDGSQAGQEYHRYYWCRVTPAGQLFPRSETTLRHIISPEEFLDTLEWGHSDPKAPMLFERALKVERRYNELYGLV